MNSDLWSHQVCAMPKVSRTELSQLGDGPGVASTLPISAQHHQLLFL